MPSTVQPNKSSFNTTTLAGGILVSCYLLYRLVYWTVITSMLSHGTKTTSAVILADRSFDVLRVFSRYSHELNYTYYYTVDGKTYKEDAGSTNYRLGDTVTVAYVPSNPSISKIISE